MRLWISNRPFIFSIFSNVWTSIEYNMGCPDTSPSLLFGLLLETKGTAAAASVICSNNFSLVGSFNSLTSFEACLARTSYCASVEVGRSGLLSSLSSLLSSSATFVSTFFEFSLDFRWMLGLSLFDLTEVVMASFLVLSFLTLCLLSFLVGSASLFSLLALSALSVVSISIDRAFASSSLSSSSLSSTIAWGWGVFFCRLFLATLDGDGRFVAEVFTCGSSSSSFLILIAFFCSASSSRTLLFSLSVFLFLGKKLFSLLCLGPLDLEPKKESKLAWLDGIFSWRDVLKEKLIAVKIKATLLVGCIQKQKQWNGYIAHC